MAHPFLDLESPRSGYPIFCEELRFQHDLWWPDWWRVCFLSLHSWRKLSVKRIWHQFRRLQYLDLSFHLNPMCAGTSRLICLLRFTPLHLASSIVSTHYSGMRSVPEDTHMRLNDDDWKAVQYTFLKGSLGLTPASWITNGADIGSVPASPSYAGLLYSAFPAWKLISVHLSTTHCPLLITSRFACTPGQFLRIYQRSRLDPALIHCNPHQLLISSIARIIVSEPPLPLSTSRVTSPTLLPRTSYRSLLLYLTETVPPPLLKSGSQWPA